jgi:magnesium transporter
MHFPHENGGDGTSGSSPPDVELAHGLRGSLDYTPEVMADPVSNWVESTLNEAASTMISPSGAMGLSGLPPPPNPIRAKAKTTTKKLPAAVQRKWLMIDTEGSTSMVSLNKQQLTQTLGVQLRDLRLLDPKLATSYPSAILCRDRSLVINLEFIKMIVGLDKCYITNLEEESAGSFVSELQRRLAAASQGLPPTKSTMDLTSATEAAGGPSGPSGFDELPFELRVLEVALDVVSQYLERLTGDLEAAAHPALDALTAKVSTENLERVRRVKNRMVRLTTRVETLREVLEKFLDDDSDMRDMNLAAKEAREAQERNQDAMRHGSVQPFDVVLPATDTKTPGTPRSATLTYDSEEEEEEAVEEVEQLLEAYFINLDNTWNKLQTLTEYIDDTEDFINIKLDSQRNQLIRLDLVLTSFTASVALITAITGLFAMNVSLSPSFEDKAPYSWFVVIAVSTSVLAVLVFASVMIYCRWKRLL